MLCFEVVVNGHTICTAGIRNQEAEMTALLCSITGSQYGSDVSQPTSISLDVGGTADDIQMTWLENFDQIQLGDTITIRILDCAEAEPPADGKGYEDAPNYPSRR